MIQIDKRARIPRDPRIPRRRDYGSLIVTAALLSMPFVILAAIVIAIGWDAAVNSAFGLSNVWHRIDAGLSGRIVR